ncbi:hypothetical protein ABEB36_009070 [Hypothenemus hampei]|uniref:Uncharacterized protein n=1 Tax=Hypothenemus hampei TaxID=57062 RepID=A0ABD1EP23_HYPHA
MNSPTARNRERILEAIDQLRKRKARPDVTRICSYLFRRFHVNSVEAKADLEWCVANNIVLKVEYKGNISYRNAAKKWAQMRHREAQGYLNNHSNAISKVTVSKNFMEILTKVFGELVMEDPDYLEIGVPPKEIIENILNKDSVRYTRNYIAILLVKEVERGNLVKLENGNYLLGPCAGEKGPEWLAKETSEQQKLLSTVYYSQQSKRVPGGQNSDGQRMENSDSVHVHSDDAEAHEKNVSIVKPKKRMIAKMQAATQRQEKLEKRDRFDSGDSKPSESNSVRLGGRRKKARKVFDPSDTHVPRKRGRPAGSLNRSTIEKQQLYKRDEDSRPDSRTSTGSREQGGVCSVCHTQSRRGPNDRMVSCRECSNKAHYGCLNGDDMMLKMYPDNTWQCPHCKTCVVCFETSDAGNLIVCSVCADGYHATCHQPRIPDKIKNAQRWLCVNCQVTDQMKPNEIQSNIGESVTHKITLSDNHDKEASRSNSASGRSSPYDSSPPSPTLNNRRKNRSETTDNEGPSDSNSGKESEQEDIDPSIPDATHWTPDDVYQYFAQYFPEEAKVFKEQEIDGRSLLLLKRLDVLTNLNLKLGPALKIYRHVTMLQVRRDDRSLYWL